jgi:ubiquitin thioesterase protein OTUB1
VAYAGVVFGYFEILLKSGDIDLIVQEKVRLQSFEQTMRAVGIDYDIIVDMFDYTWDLFDDIHRALGRGNQSESVLLESMNDENKSNSIVYHIKVCPPILIPYMSLTKIHTDDDQFIHAAPARPL